MRRQDHIAFAQWTLAAYLHDRHSVRDTENRSHYGCCFGIELLDGFTEGWVRRLSYAPVHSCREQADTHLFQVRLLVRKRQALESRASYRGLGLDQVFSRDRGSFFGEVFLEL